MNILRAFTRQVAQLDNSEVPTNPILYRAIHPAQDLALLKSIECDVGLAPGLALLYDDDQVLVYLEELVCQLPEEHSDFYKNANGYHDWLGLTWELCVQTDDPDFPVEVLSSGAQAYVDALAAALNKTLQPSAEEVELVPVPGAVHVVDPAGNLYAVSCRLEHDDDDSVYHVRCGDEITAQECALKQLYEEAGSDPQPGSEGYRQHFIITSQMVAQAGAVQS